MKKIIAAVSLLCLISCSTQAWYQSAKDAQTAHCLKGPISEYEDCKTGSTDSYNEYEKERDSTII